MSVSSVLGEQLALHGGIPVRSTLLPYGRQSIDENDIRAVLSVLRSDWLTTGPKIPEFEEEFAARVGAKYAVTFSSGTAALHAAAFAAGLTAGDEVITTPMTFAASANCVLYQGGTPIFADVCRDTLNLDPDLVAARITRRTKAIIAVDYAGHPADLNSIRALAERHGLVFIEDACHALGAEYHDHAIGSYADMTVFSFHPVKHVTTGEGGMVTTSNSATADTLRLFRNHGLSSEARQRQRGAQWQYDMVLLGFNYRLSDLACALGLEQLKRLNTNLERRRDIAMLYDNALRHLEAVQRPSVRQDVNPAWHLYPIRLNLEKLQATREQILCALRAENIGVNVHYPPVHRLRYYRDRFGFLGGELPVAEDAYDRLISLPMFHGMSDEDVNDVVRALRKVLAHFAN